MRFAPAREFLLGYGVMVTLQILVLPFLVRVRVPQHKKETSTEEVSFLIFMLLLFFCSVLGIDGLDLLAYQLYLVFQLLHLAVHLVNE